MISAGFYARIITEEDMPKKTHPINELDARMNPEVLTRAKKRAEQESLNIRLGMLREKYGMKQSEITACPKNSSKKELLLRI